MADRRKQFLKAMRYGLFPGGKRIRPILTLTAGEMFGAKQKELMPFACAVELIHAYSIIHDDLPAMDNDDLRRGEPTAHKVFGEGMALLAGDGLLTEAFHLISGPEVRRLPAELVFAAHSRIIPCSRCGGLGRRSGSGFRIGKQRCRSCYGRVYSCPKDGRSDSCRASHRRARLRVQRLVSCEGFPNSASI